MAPVFLRRYPYLSSDLLISSPHGAVDAADVWTVTVSTFHVKDVEIKESRQVSRTTSREHRINRQ